MSSSEDRGKVSVHRASPGDAATLVALMHDFYAEAGFALNHEWAEASFHALLANPSLGSVWLALLGAEPIGHAVLTVRYTMEHGCLSGYIDDLYVRPSKRRNGAGTLLLNDLFDDCRLRGCQFAYVEAAADNVPALALYGSFGLLAGQDNRVLLAGAIPKPGADS